LFILLFYIIYIIIFYYYFTNLNCNRVQEELSIIPAMENISNDDNDDDEFYTQPTKEAEYMAYLREPVAGKQVNYSSFYYFIINFSTNYYLLID